MPAVITGSKAAAPELTLVGFQDDATSQILAAQFQLEAENALGYLRALHAMITSHGVPLSLYRDRHSIFQRNDSYWTLAEQLAGKQAPTQLGRGLEELGIEQITAYCFGSSQRNASHLEAYQCAFLWCSWKQRFTACGVE